MGRLCPALRPAVLPTWPGLPPRFRPLPTCAQAPGEPSALKAGEYKMAHFCVEPTSFEVSLDPCLK